MGIEIERRFLVVNETWKSQVFLSENYSQAYLNSSIDEWSTRVRLINNIKAYITLKSSLNGLTNYEFEYSIPTKDAVELIKLSKYKITKIRHKIKINKSDWVVDIFGGSNFSLKIAEVELNHEDEEIQVPSWCIQEITGIKSFSNASLARTPISQLSVKDRLKQKES